MKCSLLMLLTALLLGAMSTEARGCGQANKKCCTSGRCGEYEHNKAFYGPVLLPNPPATSKEACLRACKRRSNCNAITFNSYTHKCTLRQVPAHAHRYWCPGNVSYKLCELGTCNDPSLICTPNGNDSPGICKPCGRDGQVACEGDPACKHGLTPVTEDDQDICRPCGAAGDRCCADPSECGNVEKNVAVWGHNIKGCKSFYFGVKSLQDCKRLCEDEPRCNLLNYSTFWKICRLKRVPKHFRRHRHHGVITYKPCEESTCKDGNACNEDDICAACGTHGHAPCDHGPECLPELVVSSTQPPTCECPDGYVSSDDGTKCELPCGTEGHPPCACDKAPCPCEKNYAVGHDHKCTICGIIDTIPCTDGCKDGLKPKPNGHYGHEICHESCGYEHEDPCESGCQDGLVKDPDVGVYHGLCRQCGDLGQIPCQVNPDDPDDNGCDDPFHPGPPRDGKAGTCREECGTDSLAPCDPEGCLGDHMRRITDDEEQICVECGINDRIPCEDKYGDGCKGDLEPGPDGDDDEPGLCRDPCGTAGLGICQPEGTCKDGFTLNSEQKCTACGGEGELACPVDDDETGNGCKRNNLVPDGSDPPICERCGKRGKGCCPGQQCKPRLTCGNFKFSDRKTCDKCGKRGQYACPGSGCERSDDVVVNGRCKKCGTPNAPPCNGDGKH